MTTTIVEDLDVRSRHLPEDIDPDVLGDLVLDGEFRAKSSYEQDLALDIADNVRQAVTDSIAETLRKHDHVREVDDA